MTPSKSTILQAMASEYGDRLVEIAREHISLAKELMITGPNGEAIRSIDNASREIIRARILLLRVERDDIIRLFEEDSSDANDGE